MTKQTRFIAVNRDIPVNSDLQASLKVPLKHPLLEVPLKIPCFDFFLSVILSVKINGPELDLRWT